MNENNSDKKKIPKKTTVNDTPLGPDYMRCLAASFTRQNSIAATHAGWQCVSGFRLQRLTEVAWKCSSREIEFQFAAGKNLWKSEGDKRALTNRNSAGHVMLNCEATLHPIEVCTWSSADFILPAPLA
jgi:hypothetical protein